MSEVNLFIQISPKEQIVPGGREVGGGGLVALFPAVRHCFPTPRVPYVNTYTVLLTDTLTLVHSLTLLHTHTHRHTHAHSASSPETRGDCPRGLQLQDRAGQLLHYLTGSGGWGLAGMWGWPESPGRGSELSLGGK